MNKESLWACPEERQWTAHDTITNLVVSEKDKQTFEDEYRENLYEEGEYHFGATVSEIKEVGNYKIKLEKKEEEKE